VLSLSNKKVNNSKYVLNISFYLSAFFPRACVILGVIFLLSSICIVIKAIHDLAKKVLPEVVRRLMFYEMFSLSPTLPVRLRKASVSFQQAPLTSSKL